MSGHMQSKEKLSNVFQVFFKWKLELKKSSCQSVKMTMELKLSLTNFKITSREKV